MSNKIEVINYNYQSLKGKRLLFKNIDSFVKLIIDWLNKLKKYEKTNSPHHHHVSDYFFFL